jgi:hypothetical protein
MENKKSISEFLEMDGNIGFNLAIFKRFSSIGDSCYAEICGGYIEGVYQWIDHNLENVEECANSKYHGWTITFTNGVQRRVYIPNWVMNVEPKDWKHAKSLFNKYLMEDTKFNLAEKNQGYCLSY